MNGSEALRCYPSAVLLLGIVGHPVSHSRSPAMHNAALAALGLAGTYVRFDVTPTDLRAAVEGLRALAIDGVNVTVPHKTDILPMLDEVDDFARQLGAVNTVVRRGRRLIGSNTDAPGLVRSLVESGFEPRGAEVLVVGAGGSARAAVVGLAQVGAARIRVAARRPEQASALVASIGPQPCPVLASGFDALRAQMAATTLLVQSTSATLGGGPAAEAFADSLGIEALPAHATVVDLVYQPLETAVLARARHRGLSGVDGLGMLLHQGALAFERFTGQPAPIDVMRAALLAAGATDASGASSKP